MLRQYAHVTALLIHFFFNNVPLLSDTLAFVSIRYWLLSRERERRDIFENKLALEIVPLFPSFLPADNLSPSLLCQEEVIKDPPPPLSPFGTKSIPSSVRSLWKMLIHIPTLGRTDWSTGFVSMPYKVDTS